MLWKVAAPRFLVPRSVRGYSQSLSSPGCAKPNRKPARARPKPHSPTHAYSRLGTEESLLHVHTASKYYPLHGQDSRPGMDQSNMNQMHGFQTQARKENRREHTRQDMAQTVQSDAERSRGSFYHPSAQYAGINSSVGGDSHLTQGFQQQTPPMWATMHSNVSANGANNGGMGFQGGPMMPINFNPFNSSMGLPPNSFTPSPGTPSCMNTGFSSPSHSFWPPAGVPYNGQHADTGPFMGNQAASSAQPNTFSRTPIPSHQISTAPRMPKEKASKSSAAADRHRLDITAPSEQSGGIPDPTDAYLMRASFLPKRRLHPGPLLVVIDLNGTLLYRPSRKNSTSFQSRRHTKEFVTYCVQTFWVVFWSSAKPENVKGMVNQLLSKPLRQQVVGVWGRDKFGLTEQDYNKRTQCYKRLTRLWNDPSIKSSYPSKRPGFEGGCWDQGNTVLIDDSVEKARSEPHNAITLPEYFGGDDDQGDVLPNVHDYLNELCHQEDVSAYMRSNPFKMN